MFPQDPNNPFNPQGGGFQAYGGLNQGLSGASVPGVSQGTPDFSAAPSGPMTAQAGPVGPSPFLGGPPMQNQAPSGPQGMMTAPPSSPSSPQNPAPVGNRPLNPPTPSPFARPNTGMLPQVRPPQGGVNRPQTPAVPSTPVQASSSGGRSPSPFSTPRTSPIQGAAQSPQSPAPSSGVRGAGPSLGGQTLNSRTTNQTERNRQNNTF